MKKSFFAVIMLCLMLVISSGQALASEATAKATLDVSQLLQVSGITWYFDGYSSGANGTLAYANAATTVSNSGAFSSSASATGDASAAAAVSSLYTAYSSQSYADNTSVGATNSNALAGYSGTWAYSGATKTVEVTIPYSIMYDLVASSGVTAEAYGNATVVFIFVSYNADQYGGINQKQEISLEMLVLNGNFKSNSSNGGSVTFSMVLESGDSGYFTFSTLTDTSAAVPLPAAVWLLGPGLAGLVGIRRRFLK